MTAAQRVYGGALYALAADEGREDELLDSARLVKKVFDENTGYLQLVQNPALGKSERLNLLDEALQGNVHPYVLSFVKILCEKSALGLFDGCLEEYIHQLYNARGILLAQAVSAVALTQEQKQALQKKLEATTGRTILLENKVDASLMGGVVVRYDGRELDGSVTGRLAAVRQMLLTEC